jgi:cytochrome c553
MRTPGLLAVTGLLAVLLPAAHAQFVVPSGQDSRQRPPAAQHCATCHGARGEGNPAFQAPRIAGQPEYYLAKQLGDFATGRRRHPTMEAFARLLAPEDRAAFAAYYARLEAPAPRRTGVKTAPERGRVLATRGDDTRGVQACANCHGPGGIGQPPAFPYLAGLDFVYLTIALQSWKDGTRANDAGGQMATAVGPLTGEDIAAVALYYAALPPPRPWPLDIVQPVIRGTSPGGTTTARAPGGGPDAAAGVGQRAPMRGATEGRGAGGASGNAAAAGADEPDRRVLHNQPVPEGDPARGRAILATGAHGCIACHTIPGIRAARGVVGPSLAGLASRSLIAGSLPNNRPTLVAFLEDPPALVPRTGMPDVRLTHEEAIHVAAYLGTLRRTGAR